MALTSGMRLASYYNLGFKVCWEAATECGAEFSELFDNDFELVAASERENYANGASIGFGSAGWNKDPVLPKPTEGENFWLTTHGIITHSDEARNRSFFPDSGVIFDVGRYMRILRPSTPVLASANRVNFTPQSTATLHIRRPYSRAVKISDGAHANEQRLYGSITDDYFCGVIEKMLVADEGLQILLCTNSDDTQDCIKSRFSDKVTAYGKSSDALDTSQSSSARDALVDLILMSRTFGIVRQVDTHFGLYASLTNLTPNLVIIRQEEGEAELGFLRYGENQAVEFDRSSNALVRFCDKETNLLRY
ncbi:hypothetical protein LRX75_11630 [Rhizobium sp. DKSPLA3]|uniref:Uncharacterized protein n=1 Tax=Rhizobium quercicola TaxID=2901226 RepID=A0A9X1NSM6_9HYPH|nr:hypothetical protein [Rhizobium quercicola]MCD7109688.1 hypothetical protein [Rhizobium quercicola]